MKYLVRCKKTLYYNWSTNEFGDNKKTLKDNITCNDLFNNMVLLVSKKDQIAVIEDAPEAKLTLNVLAGKSYDINLSVAKQFFSLIYLDDVCFDTKQRLFRKLKK